MNKSITIILLFVIIYQYSFAGSFDKLDSQLEKLDDRGKIELLSQYRFNESDANYGIRPEFLKYAKLLQKLAEKNEDNKAKSIALCNIGICYFHFNKMDSSIYFIHESIDLCESENNYENLFDALAMLRFSLRKSGKYNEGILYYSKILDKYKNNDNKSMLAICHHALAGFYFFTDFFSDALDNYLKAYHLFKETGETMWIANETIAAGNVYVEIQYTEKAYKHLKEGIDSAKNNNLFNLQAWGFQCLGDLERSQKRYKPAIKNYEKALKISRDIENFEYVSDCLNRIGTLYLETGQSKKAIEYFLESFDVMNDNNVFFGNYQGGDNVYTNLANAYLDINDLSKAKSYLDLSINEAKKTNSRATTMQNYLLLTKLYRKMGNPYKALDYHMNYANLKDSIFNIESSQKIANITALREQQKKDAEIKLLNERNKHDEEQKKVITISAAVGIGLLILLALGLYNRYRFKTRTGNLLEKKNKYITDSIKYAKSIQTAILPEENYIKNLFPNYVIFYKPKDIVSGDFYWITEINGNKLAAVVDCTGHGVPGAFMSMIGSQLLNQIVNEQKITDPAAILENMEAGVKAALQRENGSGSVDGMDLSIISYDGDKLTFAGARQHLYISDGTKLEVIKGTPRSIGYGLGSVNPFQNFSLSVEKHPLIYLACDGFADQNDPQGKKYGSRRFKKLIVETSKLPLSEQKKKLHYELKSFMGDEIQRDDITVLGFQL